MPQKLHRQTKSLSVRPLKLSDYESWRRGWSTLLTKKNQWDVDSRKPHDLSRAKFKDMLKTQTEWRKTDRFYDLGLFHRKTGELVGFVAIMDVSRKLFQNAYLGYRIFNPYWGYGYAVEGSQAAFDIAFRDLKLHRLEAGIAPKNKRSIGVARKLGLRKEGRCPRRLFLNDKWEDMLIFAITCEELGFKWKPSAEVKPRVQ